MVQTQRIGLLVIVEIFLILLFIFFPMEEINIDKSSGDLIKITGIISALITAYIVQKINFIRSKKEEIKKEIKDLSYKLTEYRRILFHILTDQRFWGQGFNVKAFKKSYPGYNYNEMHKDDPINWLQSYFWSREKRYSQTKFDLYLGIEALVKDTKNRDNWVFDDTINFSYKAKFLEDIHTPSSVIWYYFDHKWHKYLKGLVNLSVINPNSEISPITQHAINIDPKFRDIPFDRFFLGTIGSDFNHKYIPRLHALIIYNSGGIPNYMKNVISTLITLLLFGVLVPAIIQATSFSLQVDRFLASLCIIVSTGGILWILLNLKRIITREIKGEYSG